MNDEQHQAAHAAAGYFNGKARELLTTDGRLHAETLIMALARMSGSLMYRGFGFDPTIVPGTAVLSDQANRHGPQLMNVMLTVLQTLGSPIGEAAIDRGWAMPNFSQLSFEQAHALLAPPFLAYCDQTAIGLGEAAVGAAIATGTTVHDCRAVLSVDKGAALAVYGFVEGMKTAPFPVAPADTAPARARRPTHAPAKWPWYKRW